MKISQLQTKPTVIPEATIRQLMHEDLPALEWGGEYAHFRRLYREIFESASQGRAVLWGIELDSEGIIGQVFVQLISHRKELANGKDRAYLYGFRIQPVHRNLGLGSRLLQVVEADCQQRNLRWLTLNVAKENNSAMRFYLRHGYQAVAPEPGNWSFLDDNGKVHHVHEPAWRMEKRLDIKAKVDES